MCAEIAWMMWVVLCAYHWLCCLASSIIALIYSANMKKYSFFKTKHFIFQGKGHLRVTWLILVIFVINLHLTNWGFFSCSSFYSASVLAVYFIMLLHFLSGLLCLLSKLFSKGALYGFDGMCAKTDTVYLCTVGPYKLSSVVIVLWFKLFNFVLCKQVIWHSYGVPLWMSCCIVSEWGPTVYRVHPDSRVL